VIVALAVNVRQNDEAPVPPSRTMAHKQLSSAQPTGIPWGPRAWKKFPNTPAAVAVTVAEELEVDRAVELEDPVTVMVIMVIVVKLVEVAAAVEEGEEEEEEDVTAKVWGT